MQRLQGYALSDIEWEKAGVSARAMAGMLGNGICLPLATKLAIHALYLSMQINKNTLIELCEQVDRW